jgi:hypothetical protein
MDYYFFNGRAIFQQERVAQEHSRESATRIANGNAETLATSGTERVKRNAGIARVSRTISERLRCDLEAGPDLQKIGQRAISRKGNRPLLLSHYSLRIGLVIT